MRWPAYLRGVLAFSLAGVLFLYLLQRLQGVLPGSLGFVSIDPDQAFNTAASFVSNTNWQSYYGEQAMGHVVQTAGLAVQNFVSAAVGIAVAVALVRGFTRSRTGELGNFWADLVRGVVRVLVPIAVAGALVLVACGVIQNFSGIHEVGQFAGGTRQWNGGAVASQEVIKELGTNGGGYFNANSAHPFENPTPFTNLFEIFLILLIPVALTRTFGVMTGSPRQGCAILAAMATIWVCFTALMMWTEFAHHGPGGGRQEHGLARPSGRTGRRRMDPVHRPDPHVGRGRRRPQGAQGRDGFGRRLGRGAGRHGRRGRGGDHQDHLRGGRYAACS
ncbi:Potassium-transporting ATPase potassium-binding subunit [Streptomyces tendae]